jgi:hypothetical protein
MVAVSPQGQLLGRPVRTNFLVDSGADLTVAHETHAATMGIDLDPVRIEYMEGVETAAQAGQQSRQQRQGVPYRRANVKMHICERWIDVPVAFTRSLKPPGLLGREGAFDQIIFAFVHRPGWLFAASA